MSDKKAIGKIGGSYPAQITKFKRPKMTLSIESHYSVIPVDDSPLELHAGYSRCVVNIIDLSGKDVRVVTANLPAREIACLSAKIKWVLQDKLLRGDELVNNRKESKNSISDGDYNALAHSEVFGFGALKGKTPADVILESGAKGVEIVNKQMEFLKQNVDRFPKNQLVIDACLAALAAESEGTLAPLEGGKSTGSLVKVVYESPIKFLKSKKTGDGKTFVYRIKIYCDYEKTKAPWTVEIMNGTSTIEVRENGAVNVSDKISNKSITTFNLTDDEAFNMADRMEADARMFESSIYKHQYKLYLEATNAWRNASSGEISGGSDNDALS